MKNNLVNKISIDIEVSASKVWDALTKPEIIKKYFFGTNVSSDWKPGSPITFTGEWEGKTYQDKGTILDIVPGKLLRYKYWSSMSGTEDKPENYANITYELTGNDGTTKLTVIQDDIPDEKTKEHTEQNWNMVLGKLKSLLEN